MSPDRPLRVEYTFGQRVTLHDWKLRMKSAGAELLRHNGRYARSFNADELEVFLGGMPVPHGPGRSLKFVRFL